MLRINLAKRLRIEEKEEIERKRKLVAIIAVSAVAVSGKTHSPALFRKRWDSEYLVNLAVRENSFVTEYRLNPSSFSLLHEILYDQLEVNSEMAG
jgi:hypothetical protein